MNALAPISRIASASLLLPTKTITGFPARRAATLMRSAAARISGASGETAPIATARSPRPINRASMPSTLAMHLFAPKPQDLPSAPPLWSWRPQVRHVRATTGRHTARRAGSWKIRACRPGSGRLPPPPLPFSRSPREGRARLLRRNQAPKVELEDDAEATRTNPAMLAARADKSAWSMAKRSNGACSSSITTKS